MFHLLAPELVYVFRGILVRAHDCPEHRAKECPCPYIKGETYGGRNSLGVGRRRTPVKYVGQQPGESGRDYCSESDEQALHGKATCALLFWKQVCDKCSKRFHADVDGGVQDPKQPGRHP